MADPDALRALRLLADEGLAPGPGWTAAHEICQAREGEPLFDRLHGLVHLIEGDRGNAGYWYRRAGEELPASTRDGWRALAVELGLPSDT